MSTPAKPSRRSDGTLQGVRQQLPWPADRPFRILSIDGGGIRGMLPAALLAEFEVRFLGGRSAGGYFDLIAGTSTGGIIALGLSIGMTGSDILEIYRRYGPGIFPPPRPPLARLKRHLRSWASVARYQYKRAPLEHALRAALGDRLLGDAERRLCVPSFDGFTEVNVFKTPHHPDFARDWKEPMVTVASATSAAPTFFPVYQDGARRFADGGVWANNPVMIALTDALSCYAVARRSIHILSLGCGDSDIRISDAQLFGGQFRWRKIIASAMHLASQNALGQAGLLVGRDHLVRIDAPPMAENPIELDDYDRTVGELLPLVPKLADEYGLIVAERFFSMAADRYEAFHGPRAQATISRGGDGGFRA